MIIRDVEWRDFPALTESYWALYEEVNEDPEMGISLLPKRPTLGEEAEWFARLFKQAQEGGGIAVVAEEEGRAVGLCTVNGKGPHQEFQHMGVLGISIARAWRGKGLGRAMMVRALERARGKYEIVDLSVFATNARARALNASLGFQVWGTQPRAVRRGERYLDVVHMQLDLSPARVP